MAAASDLLPLPRPPDVSCARKLAFGPKMPWKRVRCARGGGTSAARRAMNSTGTLSPKAMEACGVLFSLGEARGSGERQKIRHRRDKRDRKIDP